MSRRPIIVWGGHLATRRTLRLRGLAMMGVPAAWVATFLVVPLCVMVAMAFARRGPYGGVEWELGLENLRRLMGYGRFGWSSAYLAILGRTLLMSAVTTLLAVAASYPLSFFIAARPARTRYLWMALVVIPLCTNLVIRTYAWMLILDNRMPPARLAQWLGWIGPSQALFPGSLAVYLGLVSSALPFAVLPLYTNVERLDWSLVEACRDLYGGRWRVFRHAILPQTRPGLAAAIVLTFIPTMGAFVVPDLLGGAKVWMVGNLIQQQFGASRDWPFGAAVSLALMVLMLGGLFLLCRRGRGEAA
ncbi:MAG: Spermidine/putrescine transport system permease protein PotB [Phycisphaerae bacterium]|nr:Spermidine/putrescine transport system permease protein PotB [Phycisphaerae bacterium]